MTTKKYKLSQPSKVGNCSALLPSSSGRVVYRTSRSSSKTLSQACQRHVPRPQSNKQSNIIHQFRGRGFFCALNHDDCRTATQN